ncbi:flagellar hook-basal body complex protein FliE [Phyllobacterium sp. 21LDTY02-6]|jgi:flagellar hook-basal body complex protein FliE|uniref:flagellar hook-basal body complex protein FliE n=1 Tax=unclassified Phyllobacterium TaxID=2638441 RepID=UPI0020205068|nr:MULTISPECIES: flagellar hook-basal body complex protein FliE [unclassified Phyllobacterium]MCO4315650.1 flagellar hook-basal body complex protein FliE [Phyllobacterium sp. 21LDTY02-6]MCX8280938.1 flagellar hook-basal body complex protein FliE [Phyllobacterium sp. 0TCS1.6C]MCX8295804.1 flagellar hook-basal body complex protein FliE [Phyllobacterium sp. 0TCS1.6A]
MIDQLLSVSTRNALSRLSETVNQSATAAPVASGQPSFDNVLSELAGSVTSKLETAEAVSVKSMTGDVPTRDVVNAVMDAEQSLQTAIAIRDKIVQAYLEISRMPI